ncbi:MAG: sodium/proline symporter [Clostridiaceae bacterium]|nr:sodium/proline symporter [Clostridiaceae bacterium]
MTSQQVQILVGIAAYLLFAIGIGIWYAKKSNKGSEAYFLGDRGLGPWVAALSAEASDMSGWLLMGLPGVAYFTGAGEAVWTAIGLAIGTYLNWRLVAVRLRKYSQIAGNAITLPDFFSNRFKDSRRILMTIASVIILVFFSIYVGSQFVTFGKLFSFVFGSQDLYITMVVLGGIFVLAYTLLGGFLAESMTDFFQALLMIVALSLVVVIGVVQAGGLSTVLGQFREIPRFADLFGIATPVDAVGNAVSSAAGNVQAVVGGKGVFGAGASYSFLNIVSCLAWGLGYFGMPQVLLRFMAIRKPSQLHKSRRIAIVWCVLSLATAVSIGMVGRALLPGLLTTASEAETVFIHMAVSFFPPLIAGLILAGILAASMSSSDSYMLIASSAVARNLFGELFWKKANDKQIMWIARFTLAAVTGFGMYVALAGDDSIFRVVSYAWAGFGAAFGPLILFSLFWKRMNLPGAIAGMVAGGGVVVLWKAAISKIGGAFAVYELLPAFLLSCAAIVVVSLLTAPPSDEIVAEFESVATLEE